MSEKVIGYILLFVGLFVIFFSGLDVWQVFTKQKQPIQLFNLKGVTIDPSAFTPQVNVPEGMEQFIQKPSSTKGVEIIPSDMLNLSSNLFAHLMLMGFIASIGAKIAMLGTQMIRPITVKLREAQDKTLQK
jgi:hypothetical protein